MNSSHVQPRPSFHRQGRSAASGMHCPRVLRDLPPKIRGHRDGEPARTGTGRDLIGHTESPEVQVRSWELTEVLGGSPGLLRHQDNIPIEHLLEKSSLDRVARSGAYHRRDEAARIPGRDGEGALLVLHEFGGEAQRAVERRGGSRSMQCVPPRTVKSHRRRGRRAPATLGSLTLRGLGVRMHRNAGRKTDVLLHRHSLFQNRSVLEALNCRRVGVIGEMDLQDVLQQPPAKSPEFKASDMGLKSRTRLCCAGVVG